MKFTDEETEETLLGNLKFKLSLFFFLFFLLSKKQKQKNVRVRRSSLTLKSVFCSLFTVKKSVRIRRCSLTLVMLLAVTAVLPTTERVTDERTNRQRNVPSEI